MMNCLLTSKGFRVFFLSLVLLVVGSGCNPSPSSKTNGTEARPPELVIYAYDSFVAPGGLGPAIVPLFEKKYQCRIQVIGSGDTGQLLTRLEIDFRRGKTTANIVVGLDQYTWGRAKPWIEPWGSWVPEGYSQLKKVTLIEKGFLPYDYGALAFVADGFALKEFSLLPPTSVWDLLKPEWKRRLLLEDPRTSTPGLGFLVYTQAVLGDSVWKFWRQFRNQWLTLTPGWDAAYGLFLKGEAPLVWSYVTSQAYHDEKARKNENSGRYRAVLFKEGQPLQVEGAAWIKGSLRSERQRMLARNFMEFMISPQVQEMVPRTNWMMPAREDIEVPLSFKGLPVVSKWVTTTPQTGTVKTLLSRWSQAVTP